MTRAVLLVSALSVGLAAAVAAQTPVVKPPAKPVARPVARPAQAPPAKAQVEAPKPPPYTYNPDGRRDPFLSLLGRGQEGSATVRPPGVPGLLIGEVTVSGILRDKSGFIAMLKAPDNKTYTVRSGQKLMDGTVKSISADVVVFSQDVSDPLSLVKQREVRKALRPGEGV